MTNTFRFMLLSLAALGIVSCSDKLTDESAQLTPSPDGTYEGSVTFKINNVGNQLRSARAGEGEEDENTSGVNDSFNAGSDFEYAITNASGANMVFLFDENNKYQSKSELQLLKTTADKEGDHAGKDTEQYFNARIRKTKDGKKWKCVMILNADPKELNDIPLTVGTTEYDKFIRETQKETLGRFIYDGQTYFTMSNTVYVDEVGEEGNKKYEIQGPVTITDDNIYETTKDAQENPVIVHVERLSAKFGLAYKGKEFITEETDLPYIIKVTDDDDKNILHVMSSADLENNAAQEQPWAIKITGWDVNGTETATYWIKNLKTSDGSPVYNETTRNIGNWNYTYSYHNTNGWNDPSRVRSYWAVDPHYNGSTEYYPEQYREADGVDSNDDAHNVLHYIAYNEIAITGGYRYAPENTFDGYDFMNNTEKPAAPTGYSYNGDYRRAGTHILVAAELLIGEEEIENGKPSGDKYSYENVFWDGENLVELKKYMLRQVLDEYKDKIYVDANGNKELKANDAEEYFDLTAPAKIKGGDGRVMLTLKTTKVLYSYDDNDGKYNQIDEKDVNYKDAINNAGTAKHFSGSKMYYAIPVQHMAALQKADKEKETPCYFNTGSYGVVRNHWYNVNITDIKTVGIPVDDPGQPIIPNDDPDEGGYIAFEIKILPWHVINQNVDF